MGEKTEFRSGEKAPNAGVYMEVGEASFHTEIQDPKMITLERGETFPKNTNKDRKWKKKTKATVH
ncbi:YjzC family protein [Paenibacillus sp.]|jgi:hypothetical protein|uniref:YjzC family protein n=1 Tax=Paenibacillus sp. TaxID=58172 RepID=UPI002816BEB0|nr:YjzC family protein [Paenibacillus sp.]MDR0267889.1 YjzC family protein [Paenibacillus sp.]